MTKIVVLFLTMLIAMPAAASQCGHPTESRVGMTILALKNEKFPVVAASKILRASPRPAFGYLHDTFGSKRKNVSRLVRLVSGSSGAKRCGITIALYATCGPCRPPRRSGGLSHFKQGLPISALNEILSRRRNQKIIHQYKRYIAGEIKFLRELSNSSSVPIYLVVFPELEDNLTDRGYYRLEAALYEIDPLIEVARNPIDGFFDNALYESHMPPPPGDLIYYKKPTWFSWDGVPGDPSREFLIEAKRRRHSTFFWRPEWQGLGRAVGRDETGVKDRNYTISGIREISALLRSLP